MSETVRISEVVLDEEIYPRHGLSDQNVSDLMRKIEAGVVIDPIILDRKSKTLIDGAHRREAFARRHEDSVPVEYHDYGSKAEMLKDSVLRNTNHGVNLTSHDKLRVIEIAERLKISELDTATMLRMSTSQLRALTPRYAAMSDPEGGEPVRIPLKASVRHLSGKDITAAQAQEIMGGAPGVSYLVLIRQLSGAIDKDLLPPRESNPAIWSELERLQDLMKKLELMPV